MRKMLFLALAVMLLGTAAYGQERGTISGTVTAELNGVVVPVPFAHILAFPVNGQHPAANVMTDSLGQYNLEVMFGNYQVRAEAMNFISEWYDNVNERSQAAMLEVTAENNPTGIDFLLGRIVINNGSIIGRIFVTGTDQGIQMAAVNLVKINGDSLVLHTFSMWNGSYGFQHLPAGAYLVDAVKEGWSHGYYPDTLFIDGNQIQHIDIGLTQNPPPQMGAISGMVTDAITELPLRNAHVVARVGNMYHRDARTDSTGHYIINNLPGGSYHLTAGKEGYTPFELTDPVVVDSGEVTGVDFALNPIVRTGISGLITDASDAPLANASVFAVNLNEHHRSACGRTAEDGTYFIMADAGNYSVEAIKEGYYRGVYPETVVVTAEGTTPNINIALEPIVFSSITGNVTDSTGALIANAMVEARLLHGRFVTHARTDSTGVYMLDHVIPGAYRVMAFHRGYAPGAYPDSVVVASDEDVTGINIVLGVIPPPGNGVISGIVTDDSTGLGIGHAMILALGFDDNGGYRHHHFRYQFSDSTGAYEFHDLPAIQFKVFAVARGYMGEFFDNVHNYEDATAVTPDAANINFGLAPRPMGPRILSGRVMASDGTYLEGAILSAIIDGEVVAVETSDPFGAYSFDDLEAGTYDIAVSGVDGSGQLNQVNIVFGDINNADVVVSPTSVDDGNVTLPQAMSLSQNYPNPFNGRTVISFHIVNPGNVELSVYNVVGQKVATLADGYYQAGDYSVNWDGNATSSGIYYYRLKTSDKTETMKMTLLK